MRAAPWTVPEAAATSQPSSDSTQPRHVLQHSPFRALPNGVLLSLLGPRSDRGRRITKRTAGA